MFEKDVYQLIRGLRAHKGSEKEYIQDSLRECGKEIRSNDMDSKSIALLKLVYLEMFGHDMGWASFHVLEVMSSSKYLQKRVGYLAAVQTFRPHTDVLMLAENLLKKDLGSAERGTIQLPLGAIPHLVNPGMANSLLTGLIPRLAHSLPAIRKKTLVTLYRLALVYPETLRPAWPKIKERLLDADEDSSVTSAIVNVICELGRHRPSDFLPLAPRLFELLTQGGNNWMAIKIIKLFSTLTPLEPRLVRKLLPPLTSIIKTTPAMSLLYECINGIIQGGIMEAAEGTAEGDEVARLCVSKLRAMLVVQGDPNLRYVALLAFAKITASHAEMVGEHQDVILECIDDADISIRIRALDLVVGMVNASNVQTVVERLLRQLKHAGTASVVDDRENDRRLHNCVVPMADDGDDDAQVSLRRKEQKSDQPPPLPEDYRIRVIERILEMCSRDSYVNMDDFDWYIGVLVDLVRQCPAAPSSSAGGFAEQQPSMADAIGSELLNIAVRVKAVRMEAAAAAQSLLLIERREAIFPTAGSGGEGVLAAAAFIVGEYASMLPDADAVLTSLTHPSSTQLPASVLMSYLQAIPKVFASLSSSQQHGWSAGRRTQTVLLLARITHFLAPLTLHPSLEVQERAVEYLDLMRLASEASASQPVDSESGDSYAEPPLLLTQALPSLFSAAELNPVAPAALRKVPVPEELDLDAPINGNLNKILQQADYQSDFEDDGDEVRRLYFEKPSVASTSSQQQRPAADLLFPTEQGSHTSSYQDNGREPLDAAALQRKKAERRERYRDDPYYIDSSRNSGTSTPVHSILRDQNGEGLDVDDIPVMELQLDSGRDEPAAARAPATEQGRQKAKRRFEVAGDETLGAGDADDGVPLASYASSPSKPSALSRAKKSLLQVDSAGLASLSLTDSGNGASQLEIERRQQEGEEMARAMREVERLRLEMQRAQERVGVSGEVPEEGMVVQRKVRRKKARKVEGFSEGGGADVDGKGEVNVRKKKRKKKRREEGGDEEETGDREVEGLEAREEAPTVKAKRKKKRQVTVHKPVLT